MHVAARPGDDAGVAARIDPADHGPGQTAKMGYRSIEQAAAQYLRTCPTGRPAGVDLRKARPQACEPALLDAPRVEAGAAERSLVEHEAQTLGRHF